jgi:hypothetical protein
VLRQVVQTLWVAAIVASLVSCRIAFSMARKTLSSRLPQVARRCHQGDLSEALEPTPLIGTDRRMVQP